MTFHQLFVKFENTACQLCAIRNLGYECMLPKNRRSKAAMDMTERAIAGIRSSFLSVCMIPVKNMSNKMMATGFLASKK